MADTIDLPPEAVGVLRLIAAGSEVDHETRSLLLEDIAKQVEPTTIFTIPVLLHVRGHNKEDAHRRLFDAIPQDGPVTIQLEGKEARKFCYMNVEVYGEEEMEYGYDLAENEHITQAEIESYA
jgi:hypothetical protein